MEAWHTTGAFGYNQASTTYPPLNFLHRFPGVRVFRPRLVHRRRPHRLSTYDGSEHDFGEAWKPAQGLDRGAGLSIDPKLFQPKSRASSFAASETVEDEMLTAKPPKTPRAKPKKGKNGEKKVSHARKQHPDHIPRPRNAFILFRKHVVDSKLIPASVEMRHQNVSIITAKMWAEAPAEQKAHFNELAKIEKEEHMKKYPGYRYQPVYRRTNVIRRRVRKDDAEEEKCRSVAELLIKGKTGEELESEIQEKIKGKSGASSPQEKKTEKPSSRRGSSAVALSKGALRALRAQARQSSVSDWSDISRANSVAPSLDEGSLDVEPGISRRPSFGPTDFSYPNEFAFEDDLAYMDPLPFFQHASFGFSNPAFLPDPNFGGPSFSYPEDAVPLQTFAYPQPVHPNPEFYAYDQALPFSPSAHMTTFDQQQSMPSDLIFSTVGETISPTAALYAPLAPSNGDLAYEGFTFGGDGMLDDFGAALAQAEELGQW